MNLGSSHKLQIELASQQNEKMRNLERETEELRVKNKALKIDKNILMKIINDMIKKNPKAVNVIDQEKFKKTLEDV